MAEPTASDPGCGSDVADFEEVCGDHWVLLNRLGDRPVTFVVLSRQVEVVRRFLPGGRRLHRQRSGASTTRSRSVLLRGLHPPRFCRHARRHCGRGYVIPTTDVNQDGRGNIWVGQYDDMLKVFNSSETFVRRVGRPVEGPVEFGSPRPFLSDDSGRVQGFDPRNARLSVIGSDFKLHDEEPLPTPVRAAAPIPGRNAIVVNSAISTGNGRLLPLHILEDMKVVHSFGREGASGARNTLRLRRRIAAGPAGQIYAAPPYEYRVDVWTSDGRRVDGLVGSDLNAVDPLAGGPSYWTWENPPPNSISAMRVDSANRLWVLLHVRDRDWEDPVREQPAPDGGVRIAPADGFDSIWHTRIDVVDLDGASLLARSRRDEILTGFVTDELVFENCETEEGFPRQVVWRIDLESGG